MDVQRLGPRTAALLAIMLVTACGLPALSSLEASFGVPELWPPPRLPLPPTSTATIDLDAVPTLEPIQLEDGPPMKLKTVSLGEPTVLLAKAKGTYYPAEHPLSDRRAMVSRVREDRHGRTLEQYEGYLVDFEDGVVETFDAISSYEQYSEAGIGFAWKTIDGVKTRVLVHADGQVIPLWPETETAPDLLLHPIWRQAWIFGVTRAPTPDPLDDPEQTELRSVYVHWTDLRQPPPTNTGPKVVLPFVLHFNERVINSETDTVDGPRPKQQADAPFVIHGNRWGCGTVELDRDGGFHCRYGSYTALAEGWSVTSFEDENSDGYVEFQNRETGTVQVIRGKKQGDDCGATYRVMDPPRAVVACDGWTSKFLWTPHSVVSFDDEDGGDGSYDSDDRLLLSSFERRTDERSGPSNYARGWLDLEAPSVVFASASTTRARSGYPYHGGWLFTSEFPSRVLHVTRVGDTVQRRIDIGERCPHAVGFADWEGDSLILSCWTTPPNPRALLGLDLDLQTSFRMPGADNRESLITATHILSTRGGQQEVVVWTRGDVWPTSSHE